MRRVCIVQARTSSNRLPGKVLLEVAGRPMLAHLLHRLTSCRSLDGIVVATTSRSGDDAIADVAARMGIQVFRGSETDVLGRIVGAAQATGADIVVRVTADCPLIDPDVTDRVVDELTANGTSTDYASNVVRRSFPRGLDVEAMFTDTLLRVDRLAQTQVEREHVTITIRSEKPDIFLVRSVEARIDDSDLRWTVDEERDLDLIRRLYEDLGLAEAGVPYRTIVDHVRAHPELATMNKGIGTWTPRREDDHLRSEG